ncbi:unnamed protein product [Chrysoparadoxa australica]
MSSTGAGYDLSPTTFSPDGKIFQVEYATKAVENSGTAIGIKCKDGVLLAVEKLLLTKMLVPGTNKKIHTIAKHAGFAVTGMGADARQIVNRGREECEGYLDNYGSHISPAVLNDRISQFVHYFTLHGSLRPFGAAVLMAAYDEEDKQPYLYAVEPSGVSYRYFGCAIGKGRQGAKTEIEKLKLAELTCKDAMKQVAKIIHVLHDDSKDKPFELEMSCICEANGWVHSVISREDVKAAEEWAKKSIEEDEMADVCLTTLTLNSSASQQHLTPNPQASCSIS